MRFVEKILHINDREILAQAVSNGVFNKDHIARLKRQRFQLVFQICDIILMTEKPVPEVSVIFDPYLDMFIIKPFLKI